MTRQTDLKTVEFQSKEFFKLNTNNIINSTPITMSNYEDLKKKL